MEKKTLISVIIPVYNGEKYVAQCIENILCQTYKNLEIIVVNDGSTDRTAQIAEQYPVRLVNQEKEGTSVARNRGIEAATGEYIHFMDVDDLINLDYYAHMLETITLTGTEIVCSGMINEIKPHRTLMYSHRWLLLTIDDKLSVTNVGKYGYCWRYLFKKSFLNEKKLRFDAGRFVGEDLLFSLQAVYWANKIATVPEAVYYYKKRVNSTMRSNNPLSKRKRHKDLAYLKNFRIQFAEEHGIRIPGVRTGKFTRYIDKWFK